VAEPVLELKAKQVRISQILCTLCMAEGCLAQGE